MNGKSHHMKKHHHNKDNKNAKYAQQKLIQFALHKGGWHHVPCPSSWIQIQHSSLFLYINTKSHIILETHPLQLGVLGNESQKKLISKHISDQYDPSKAKQNYISYWVTCPFPTEGWMKLLHCTKNQIIYYHHSKNILTAKHPSRVSRRHKNKPSNNEQPPNPKPNIINNKDTKSHAKSQNNNNKIIKRNNIKTRTRRTQSSFEGVRKHNTDSTDESDDKINLFKPNNKNKNNQHSKKTTSLRVNRSRSFKIRNSQTTEQEKDSKNNSSSSTPKKKPNTPKRIKPSTPKLKSFTKKPNTPKKGKPNTPKSRRNKPNTPKQYRSSKTSKPNTPKRTSKQHTPKRTNTKPNTPKRTKLNSPKKFNTPKEFNSPKMRSSKTPKNITQNNGNFISLSNVSKKHNNNNNKNHHNRRNNNDLHVSSDRKKKVSLDKRDSTKRMIKKHNKRMSKKMGRDASLKNKKRVQFTENVNGKSNPNPFYRSRSKSKEKIVTSPPKTNLNYQRKRAMSNKFHTGMKMDGTPRSPLPNGDKPPNELSSPRNIALTENDRKKKELFSQFNASYNSSQSAYKEKLSKAAFMYNYKKSNNVLFPYNNTKNVGGTADQSYYSKIKANLDKHKKRANNAKQKHMRSSSNHVSSDINNKSPIPSNKQSKSQPNPNNHNHHHHQKRRRNAVGVGVDLSSFRANRNSITDAHNTNQFILLGNDKKGKRLSQSKRLSESNPPMMNPPVLKQSHSGNADDVYDAQAKLSDNSESESSADASPIALDDNKSNNNNHRGTRRRNTIEDDDDDSASDLEDEENVNRSDKEIKSNVGASLYDEYDNISPIDDGLLFDNNDLLNLNKNNNHKHHHDHDINPNRDNIFGILNGGKHSAGSRHGSTVIEENHKKTRRRNRINGDMMTKQTDYNQLLENTKHNESSLQSYKPIKTKRRQSRKSRTARHGSHSTHLNHSSRNSRNSRSSRTSRAHKQSNSISSTASTSSSISRISMDDNNDMHNTRTRRSISSSKDNASSTDDDTSSDSDSSNSSDSDSDSTITSVSDDSDNETNSTRSYRTNSTTTDKDGNKVQFRNKRKRDRDRDRSNKVNKNNNNLMNNQVFDVNQSLLSQNGDIMMNNMMQLLQQRSPKAHPVDLKQLNLTGIDANANALNNGNPFVNINGILSPTAISKPKSKLKSNNNFYNPSSSSFQWNPDLMTNWMTSFTPSTNLGARQENNVSWSTDSPINSFRCDPNVPHISSIAITNSFADDTDGSASDNDAHIK